MGRKNVEIKSLYNLTIDDLNFIEQKLNNSYSSDVIKAVIMCYKGVPTQIIADTLGKCVATIVSYINRWNAKGIASITDHRGGNVPASLTDEMTKDILDVVTNKNPNDFDYECNKWDCKLLSRYIDEKYGRKYSTSWVRLTLKSLGFTYKRGVYKSTLGDEKLQESFKKNVQIDGYY